MNSKSFFILLVFIATICSCHKEDPLEKERKEFQKSIEDNTALTLYRGVKISLRSFPINLKAGDADELMSSVENKKPGYEKVNKYTAYILNSFMGIGKKNGEISVKETIELVKAFRQLKDELKDKNEDDFPTLLEVILYLDKLKGNGQDALLKTLKWNNSKEHLVLSAALMAAKPLPPGFQLYETSKFDVPKLENTEIKPLAGMFKGIVMMQNKWYYLSEEALTQGIESLDAGKLKFEYEGMPSFFPEAKIDSRESEIAQMHGLSCLIRGFVRTKMDDKKKKKLAIDDFELFISDANKIGADNELVWLAGAYVGIKKEDNAKAISYLEKLEKSEQFTDNEKDAIKEIKEYISQREEDKALNVIYDKVFIGKLVASYLYNFVTKANYYKALNQSESGKKLLEIPGLIDTEYQKMEKELNPGGLKEKGKELIKNITF
jgi:hypothetical protein